MPICPCCNHSFTVKKTAKLNQETIERDGVQYYASLTNFTTGARKTLTSFPVKETKKKPKSNYATHETWRDIRGYWEGLKALNFAYGQPEQPKTGFVMVGDSPIVRVSV